MIFTLNFRREVRIYFPTLVGLWRLGVMFKPEQLCPYPLLLTTDHSRTQVFGSAVIRGGTTNVSLILLTETQEKVMSRGTLKWS